jgi:ADP-ribose pyrophosphatase YjhB (NUDIX family)
MPGEDDRRFPPRPIVGVGAVVIEERRVLLVRRARPPLLGEWSLPGGAVEVGETLAAAVQREVLEETGIVVAVGPVVEVLGRLHTDADGRVDYHYVLIDYLCTVVGGRLAAASDASGAAWAHGDDLAAFGLHPVTIEVVRKAFELVGRGGRRSED